MTDETTNGALVESVRARVADALARTGVRPGRRRLARDLGVTEYAVRQALDNLAAEQPSNQAVTGVDAGGEPANGMNTDTPTRATSGDNVRPTTAVEPIQVRPACAVEHSTGELRDEATATDSVVVAPGARGHPVRRWPLLLIALPAFVAIWGGWVGLGRMAGFGPVEPLPGIASLTIDLAITLPVGVEVYSAYALSVWLANDVHGQKARRFAAWSAVSSLVVGAAGQVAYHLMTAAGMTVAPWWVTAVVAALPVATLGMATALHHLTRQEGPVAVRKANGTREEPAPGFEDDSRSTWPSSQEVNQG